LISDLKKVIMQEENDFHLRGEEVQEILTRVPHWMIC